MNKDRVTRPEKPDKKAMAAKKLNALAAKNPTLLKLVQTFSLVPDESV